MIYLITNLINNKQYIGAEKNNNPEYFGSGRLIIEAIEKFGKWNFKKEILIGGIGLEEELYEIESYFIIGLNTLVPNGYNQKIYQWPPSIEISSKAGKKAAKTNKRQGTSVYDPRIQSIGGKIGGRKNKELETGIFAPDYDRSEAGRKGGKIVGKIVGKQNKELKRGIFAPGMQSKGGKMTVHIYFEIDGLIQQMTLGAILKL